MHPEYNILIMYEEDFAMKLVIMEPLGVEKEALLALAEEKLEGRVEIEYYDTRVTDTDTLISRAKDAELLAFSNLPFPDVYKRQECIWCAGRFMSGQSSGCF